MSTTRRRTAADSTGGSVGKGRSESDSVTAPKKGVSRSARRAAPAPRRSRSSPPISPRNVPTKSTPTRHQKPPPNEGARLLALAPGSQRSKAAALGVSNETVRRWVAGDKVPFDQRPELERVFGIPPHTWDRRSSRTAEPASVRLGDDRLGDAGISTVITELENMLRDTSLSALVRLKVATALTRAHAARPLYDRILSSPEWAEITHTISQVIPDSARDAVANALEALEFRRG